MASFKYIIQIVMKVIGVFLQTRTQLLNVVYTSFLLTYINIFQTTSTMKSKHMLDTMVAIT
jgi:hypothetical protein